jgi:hypothetical protein
MCRSRSAAQASRLPQVLLFLFGLARTVTFSIGKAGQLPYEAALYVFGAGSIFFALAVIVLSFRWVKLGLQIRLQRLDHPRVRTVRVFFALAALLLFALYIISLIDVAPIELALVGQIAIAVAVAAPAAAMAAQLRALHRQLSALHGVAAAMDESYGSPHGSRAVSSAVNSPASSRKAARRDGLLHSAAPSDAIPSAAATAAAAGAGEDLQGESARRVRAVRNIGVLTVLLAAEYAAATALMLVFPDRNFSPAFFLFLRVVEFVFALVALDAAHPEATLLGDADADVATAAVGTGTGAGLNGNRASAGGDSAARDAASFMAYNYSYGAGLVMDDDRYAGYAGAGGYAGSGGYASGGGGYAGAGAYATAASSGGATGGAGVGVGAYGVVPIVGSADGAGGQPLAVSQRLHAGSLGAAAARMGYSPAVYAGPSAAAVAGGPAAGGAVAAGLVGSPASAGFSRFGPATPTTAAMAMGGSITAAPAPMPAPQAPSGGAGGVGGGARGGPAVGSMNESGEQLTVGSRYSLASTPISYTSYGQFSPYAPQGHRSHFVLNAQSPPGANVGSPPR